MTDDLHRVIVTFTIAAALTAVTVIKTIGLLTEHAVKGATGPDADDPNDYIMRNLRQELFDRSENH